MYSVVGTQQTNAMRTMMKRNAEPSEAASAIKAKGYQSCSELIADLQPECTLHKRLEHSNRAKYRHDFFRMLPRHQLLNLAQKVLSKHGEFERIQELQESIEAEPCRRWKHWDFFIDALSSDCICNQELNEELAAEVETLVVRGALTDLKLNLKFQLRRV